MFISFEKQAAIPCLYCMKAGGIVESCGKACWKITRWIFGTEELFHFRQLTSRRTELAKLFVLFVLKA